MPDLTIDWESFSGRKLAYICDLPDYKREAEELTIEQVDPELGVSLKWSNGSYKLCTDCQGLKRKGSPIPLARDKEVTQLVINCILNGEILRQSEINKIGKKHGYDTHRLGFGPTADMCVFT